MVTPPFQVSSGVPVFRGCFAFYLLFESNRKTALLRGVVSMNLLGNNSIIHILPYTSCHLCEEGNFLSGVEILKFVGISVRSVYWPVGLAISPGRSVPDRPMCRAPPEGTTDVHLGGPPGWSVEWPVHRPSRRPSRSSARWDRPYHRLTRNSSQRLFSLLHL